MNDPRSTAANLGAFALVAGLAQILATVRLGVEPIDALTLAAAQGPRIYLAATAALALGIALLWVTRRRPLVAALVFVTLQAAVFWPLSRHMTVVGLALHGEFILHHFIAVISTAAGLAAAWFLARARDRGPLRLPIAAVLATAIVTELVVHVASARAPLGKPLALAHGLAAIAMVAMLLAWSALELRRSPRSHPRWAAFALLAPLALRVGSVAPGDLAAVAIPEPLRGLSLALMILAAAALAVLLRPRPLRSAAIFVTGLGALTVATVYLAYDRQFGEVEDGLGGLAASILGFMPPYPDYVPGWIVVAAMLGAFVAMQTAGAALTSVDARDRGLGIALVVIAGLGWSSPQLALMSTLGALLYIADDDPRRLVIVPAPRPVPEIVDELAGMLAIEASTASTGRDGGSICAARGVVDDVPFVLRARTLGNACELGIRLGVPGRGAPEVELRPDRSDGGVRPTHLLARTHRVIGSARALEIWGDGVLDALVPFPTAIARLWPTGVEVELGPDLSQLDAERLATLARALARVLRP